MINRNVRIRVAIVLIVLFTVSTAVGIYRKEFWDIITNATMICYSCIGIK